LTGNSFPSTIQNVAGNNYLTGDDIMLELIEEIEAKLAERAEFIAYINSLLNK